MPAHATAPRNVLPASTIGLGVRLSVTAVLPANVDPNTTTASVEPLMRRSAALLPISSRRDAPVDVTAPPIFAFVAIRDAPAATRTPPVTLVPVTQTTPASMARSPLCGLVIVLVQAGAG